MAWFEGYDLHTRTIGTRPVRFRVTNQADWQSQNHLPVLVLLHGFPQTHVLWHRVAKQLRGHYRMVMPDLRGYGGSSCELGEPDHSNYSKRVMAQEIIDLLDSLGVNDFFLCGHDRGGRVSHRLALEHGHRVRKMCVLDIAPTLDMYQGTNFEFAQAYYHWFHLIQPAPVPEVMIGGNPEGYLRLKMKGWGSNGGSFFEPEAMDEYVRCFSEPTLNEKGWRAAVHAKAEDYRASAGIDLEHDRASRAKGEKIPCDLLVMCGDRGVVHRLFDAAGLWQAQCQGRVSYRSVPSGHYIPEELPEVTTQALLEFMR
ncbi:MAG: alpha/beta hydrolase [Alphaproteobacteria bacterium]|nr:alpha/beta hydrolase [Alphaproteobacteria bacterium]